jgi:CRP-like cAMP-binding protein
MPSSMEQKRAWLAAVPLFRGCSPEVLQRLAAVVSETDFAPDQPIVLQGQVGNGLYIVVSGAARVVQGADVLARLGPGDFFGELAVIDQQPRSASAYAEGPSSCLALASWDLMALLAEEPALALNLLRELASRLRRADAQLRH